MSETLLEPGERARNQLRAAIAEVAVHASSLALECDATNQAAQASALSSAWQKLLPLIEPEAEPARRACPHCQRRIRVQATRCLYCLEKSQASGG
jgi:RNA polymerase subunit RPABC4/transcription elongation factor Spt4